MFLEFVMIANHIELLLVIWACRMSAIVADAIVLGLILKKCFPEWMEARRMNTSMFTAETFIKDGKYKSRTVPTQSDAISCFRCPVLSVSGRPVLLRRRIADSALSILLAMNIAQITTFAATVSNSSCASKSCGPDSSVANPILDVLHIYVRANRHLLCMIMVY